jgi:hypothetical protein
MDCESKIIKISLKRECQSLILGNYNHKPDGTHIEDLDFIFFHV